MWTENATSWAGYLENLSFGWESCSARVTMVGIMSEKQGLSLQGRSQHNNQPMSPKEHSQLQKCVPSFVGTSSYPSLTFRPPHQLVPSGCFLSTLYTNLPEGTDSRNRVTIIRDVNHKKTAALNKGPMFVNNLLLS